MTLHFRMKSLFLPVAVLLASTCLTAQQLPKWYRVYTFDESIIEMNTSLVTFGGKDLGRVRFRWTFDQPETLSRAPSVKYQSRVEVIEFDCPGQRYRPVEATLFDPAGKAIRHEETNSPVEWRTVTSESMMPKLFEPACKLIRQKTRIAPSNEEIEEAIELEKVARYALSFSESLQRIKNFSPVIEQFFATTYLDRFLNDQNTNRFLNLDRDTAARISRSELRRFYVATMNTGYLSSRYLMSQYPSDSDAPVSEEKLMPPDIINLIAYHPYTAMYKPRDGNYDYLGEKIDSPERLRSYTDLLERIGELMRKHLKRVEAEHPAEHQAMLDNWDFPVTLYKPTLQICPDNCLGLPKGTKLFEVDVPVFRLHLAKIKGRLKVVSATAL
jgi:hypothetical protein